MKKKSSLPVKIHSLPSGPIGSTEEYVHFVNSIPMLTDEEEKALALQLKEDGNLDAAQALILSHLRFVVSVARSFVGYGLTMSDLIQEGNIGLMKAVKRFDPSLGVRLVSFAVHWIKAEMHDFIIKNWRIVKIATTKPQRKLFFNLRSSHKRLGWMNKDEISNVAKILNVKESDVIEMEKRMNNFDMQFDAPLDDEQMNELPTTSPSFYLAAPDSANPEHQIEEEENLKKTAVLHSALDALDDRSRDIMIARFLHEPKATLHELASRYNITLERVRQIETAALKKLKKTLR